MNQEFESFHRLVEIQIFQPENWGRAEEYNPGGSAFLWELI